MFDPRPQKRCVFLLSLFFVLCQPIFSLAADELPALSLEETIGLKSASGAVMSPNGDAIAYLLSVPRTLYEDKDGSA